LEQLTSSQLAEWEEYSKIDPIGEWRDDFKFAYMASIITNLMISAYAKKGTKLTKLEDFLIKWDTEEAQESGKKQSVEEMKQMLMRIAEVQNRKVDVETKLKK
jgi:DNA-directed RNA polymerase specialized sigma24 family protein